MSRYHNVTRSEIESFLLPLGFTPIALPNVHEIVYGKRFFDKKYAVSMRIYSSIEPNGLARECGADAIRVTSFTMYQGCPMPIGKSQKVLRVKTWQKNLAKAIEKCNAELKDCPKCGNPMVLRNGRHGDFWGCTTFKATGCDGKPK